MEISTIGLDLAKSIFQVHAVGEDGKVVVKRSLRRSQVLPFFRKLGPCMVGMEACGTSHHWARQLAALGHEVRLMPPAYVKPYVKRGKTDANDAEAICEAVTRPTMRFVAVKSREQQAALALHRTRDLLVKQRTQLVNMIRGFLAEQGVETPRGLHHALALSARLVDGDGPQVPALVQRVVEGLARQIAALQTELGAIEKEILAWHRSSEVSQRLATIPGIGIISATALCCLGHRPAAVPLGPRVCSLAWPDAAPELERRQGADGPDLEDGRQVSAPPAGGGHDIAGQASQGQPHLCRSSHHRLAGKEAGAPCHGRYGKPHRKDRLGRHGAGGDLSPASENGTGCMIS